MSSPICRFLAGALCLLGVVGCGTPKAQLEGRLLEDGQPMQWKESTPLEVRAACPGASPDKPGLSFEATVDKDGHFTLRAPDGGGIPPGDYTFAVRTTADRPGVKQSVPQLLGLTDPAKSPLKYKVTADSKQRIAIDLKKETVEREP
jgi:hypothetical protein